MSTKKVAIIGVGNIGKAISRNLVKGNRSFILTSRNLENAQKFAKELGNLGTVNEIKEAIQQSDIVIMAVSFKAVQELLKQYASELKGKIIIDPSNPLGLDENGKLKKLIGESESAGQINAQFLPEKAKLVKAWSSLSATNLAKSAFQEPEFAVLFYATDDETINADVELLIQDNGYTPFRIGNIEQSIRIEFPGDLSELGLGKTVSLAEAKTII
ncbi:NADPH-dependent F420 reductase [Chryseobacterium sp. LAM-KRS1]|uniref:NADPH-dependent F420 reductase n=1 Tax=Chryseobacterium sp. LAM-KRS1 TaxID=2715754 RepID=UPI001554A171|nr:NAD(P)-binding domain-containing protein [Chryseobacterium sp. LAM-KRS1]